MPVIPVVLNPEGRVFPPHTELQTPVKIKEGWKKANYDTEKKVVVKDAPVIPLKAQDPV